MIKKIVIIGPESTGKSTLCKQLAQHYNTSWVPEFAREYLEQHGTNYTYEDLLSIAKGQVTLEEEMQRSLRSEQPGISNQQSEVRYQVSGISYEQLEVSNSKSEIRNLKSEILNRSLLFIDTDMYVMKVWCEFTFNKCHNWILNQIALRKYDLYLLCNIDLPWVKDDLREYPDFDTRAKLYFFYKDIMINQATPWINISGDYKQRFEKAEHAIDSIL